MSSSQGPAYTSFNRKGYSSINSNQSEDDVSIHSQSSSHRPISRTNRTRLVLLGVAAAFLLTTAYLSSSSSLKNPEFTTFADDFATKEAPSPPPVNFLAPGISDQAFRAGLAKCHAIEQRRNFTRPKGERTWNPRAVPGTKPLLIKDGVLWMGDGYLDGYDVLLENGLIARIDKNIEAPEDARVIEANGRVVTPGIIDMHSHMGVRAIEAFNPSDPGIRIVSSGGITTSLILPGSGNVMGGEALAVKLRPVSTLSVEDMQVAAGVTDEKSELHPTSDPRSPNIGMGEAYLVRKRLQSAQQLLHAQDDWCNAAEQIAEQPRSTYRLSERFPEDLENESLVALLRGDVKLNIHCYEPHDIEAMIRHSIEFEFEITAFHHALQAWKIPEVIKRARNNITVATFADYAFAIFFLIRYYEDMWGYKVEAYPANVNTPKILTDAGIPVAFKSDHPVLNSQDLVWEAAKAYHYGLPEHLALSAVTSVPARAMGLDHRIGHLRLGYDADVVIWENHPLTLGARPAQVVVDGVELDFEEDLLTKQARKVLGEEDENEKANKEEIKPMAKLEKHDHEMTASVNGAPVDARQACSGETDTFVIRNIGKLFLSQDRVFSAADVKGKEIVVIVYHGKLRCAGTDCREKGEWPEGPVFDLQHGYVLPVGFSNPGVEFLSSSFLSVKKHVVELGLISTGARIGLIEIESESSAIDGFVSNNPNDPDLEKSVVRAVDGLKFGGLHLEKPYKAGYVWAGIYKLADARGHVVLLFNRSGVLTSLTQPIIGWGGFISGVSSAFRTGALNTVLDDDIIVKDEAALHVLLGASAFVSDMKYPYRIGRTIRLYPPVTIPTTASLTVSQQVALLRRLLLTHINTTAAADPNSSIFTRAAHGHLPVVVYTENKDEIASVVTIKRATRAAGGSPRFIIMGATESWLVADHLAREDIAVILRPARCTPRTWFSQHCLVGPPISPVTALDVLVRKGVLVGLASLDVDDGYVRNLVWDAGGSSHHAKLRFLIQLVTGWNLATNPTLTETDAVGLVSWNIAKMFGLRDTGRIEEGSLAELVAYNGNPFQMGTKVQLVVGGGRKGITCFPQQV
ncbi:hypothetical protein BC938DRAFT_476063 [Jimgerdemannia flammicorona]|uniref:Amidohydrolase-related domain-containing protein n=1 Tax=Jimgerdemannia flammicorona TaxID=994334 RepID=A0A433QZB1_9FUNG|nr:hypothetical protein BC938DRAFT_476063 [Jimgerdemannia flammicorona]